MLDNYEQEGITRMHMNTEIDNYIADLLKARPARKGNMATFIFLIHQLMTLYAMHYFIKKQWLILLSHKHFINLNQT